MNLYLFLETEFWVLWVPWTLGRFHDISIVLSSLLDMRVSLKNSLDWMWTGDFDQWKQLEISNAGWLAGWQTEPALELGKLCSRLL